MVFYGESYAQTTLTKVTPKIMRWSEWWNTFRTSLGWDLNPDPRGLWLMALVRNWRWRNNVCWMTRAFIDTKAIIRLTYYGSSVPVSNQKILMTFVWWQILGLANSEFMLLRIKCRENRKSGTVALVVVPA